MAQDSKIEWCHDTANLWIGCVEVHEGCDNCYARVLNNRWGHKNWGHDTPRREVKKVWSDLKRFQKLAEASGETRRVFVGSMMDIFEKPMPLIDSKGNKVTNVAGVMLDTGDLRDSLFRQIELNIYPNLLFLLLTKRPSNINKYIPESWKENPPVNVMFGTSPVNQATADKLIPQLLQVKGKRFLSVEPQLDFINLAKSLSADLNGIHWVIQGGESGHHKRPFNLEWAYKMKDQCEILKIPYFFKQIDKVQPIPDDLMTREFPILNKK